MLGNWLSETGNKVGVRKTMENSALDEARGWASALMDHEFKGRGDREKSIRYRLSRKIGVPESYLYRLQYKTREMKDVAGSVYRALMIAYNNACEKNEAAAARYRAERLGLRGNHETADQELNNKVLGAGASGLGSETSHAKEEA